MADVFYPTIAKEQPTQQQHKLTLQMIMYSLLTYQVETLRHISLTVTSRCPSAKSAVKAFSSSPPSLLPSLHLFELSQHFNCTGRNLS